MENYVSSIVVCYYNSIGITIIAILFAHIPSEKNRYMLSSFKVQKLNFTAYIHKSVDHLSVQQ